MSRRRRARARRAQRGRAGRHGRRDGPGRQADRGDPLRPDGPRRDPGPGRSIHPATGASTSCSTSRATPIPVAPRHERRQHRQDLHDQRLRDARPHPRGHPPHVRPGGQDPQRRIDGGHHLATRLAGVRLVQGGGRVAVGDPRGRAGRQRDQDLQHLAGADGHGAAPQAGARGGPVDDHAAGPGRRRHRPADERRRGHARRPEHHRPHAGLRAGGCAGSNTGSRARSSGSSRLFASRLAVAVRQGRPRHGPGPDPGRQPAPHPPGDARAPSRAPYVLLLEPYSYGLAGKLAYLVRLVRGMYHLQTAGLFVVDNAYLPIHVAPHRPRRRSSRCGTPPGRSSGSGWTRRCRSRSRSGRSCIATTTRSSSAAEWTRGPYAAALRTPIERVLALGSPADRLLLR